MKVGRSSLDLVVLITCDWRLWTSISSDNDDDDESEVLLNMILFPSLFSIFHFTAGDTACNCTHPHSLCPTLIRRFTGECPRHLRPSHTSWVSSARLAYTILGLGTPCLETTNPSPPTTSISHKSNLIDSITQIKPRPMLPCLAATTQPYSGAPLNVHLLLNSVHFGSGFQFVL
jgi:hypothetical protein